MGWTPNELHKLQNLQPVITGFEGYSYTQVLVKLTETGMFGYDTKTYTPHDPYSQPCESMSFWAEIMEGKFREAKIHVVREFDNPMINPTRGAFIFSGRKCFVSGKVIAFNPDSAGRPMYYKMDARRVWRTCEVGQECPVVNKKQIVRYNGSIVDFSDEEACKQSKIDFDC